MPKPFTIDKEALYDDGTLRQSLGFTSSVLASARRSGALRFTRQGQRNLYKGSWILDWLEADANTASKEADRKGVNS